MNSVYYESLVGDERQDYVEEMASDLATKKLIFMLETVDKSLEIAREEAELKVLSESGTCDDLVVLYTEAEEEANKKKDGIIRKIATRIKTMINTIIGKIHGLIERISEHMSGEFAVSRKLLQWGDELVKIGRNDLPKIDFQSVGSVNANALLKKYSEMSHVPEEEFYLTNSNYNTISGNEYRALLTDIKALEIAYGKKVDLVFADHRKTTPTYSFGADYADAAIGYQNTLIRFLKIYGSPSTKEDAKFVRIIRRDKNVVSKGKDKKVVKDAKKADVEI